METAARLLSETAHDLRTPLTAVRESARLVNDGYLGPTTEEQRHCLAGIFEQCDLIEELVTDMLSLEQLRSGLPRVHRAWIDPATIQQAVTKTIEASLRQRDVALVWDRIETLSSVFADAGKISRLLLNLIGNSLQVVPAGGQVLVRVEAVESLGLLRFTVIDHGPGMAPELLRRLTQRGESGHDGKGLGLAISRQMAALHFSTLEITTRPGEGTRVAFELPAAGPASVADAWIRWRAQFMGQRTKPKRRSDGVRLDQPQSLTRSRPTVGDGLPTAVLMHDGGPPHSASEAVSFGLRLGGTVATELADQWDQRLQDNMRMYEMAYRADTRRWVLLLDCDATQASDRVAALETQLVTHFPAARVQWSPMVKLPIGMRASRATLRELLIRDSLGTPSAMPTSDDRKLGSGAPLPAISQVASRRLEDELRRLTARVSAHRDRLQQQAIALRTPVQ